MAERERRPDGPDRTRLSLGAAVQLIELIAERIVRLWLVAVRVTVVRD
ncbi:MAG TPA: hypothetical protein VIP48_02675 [Streptosporangiaceae bacterium]